MTRKIKIYTTNGMPGTIETNVSTLGELKPILRNLKFNGIYLIGFNYKEVQEYLLKSENYLTLF